MDTKACYIIFDECIKTLCDASLDDDNSDNMTNSLLNVICFDDVKKKYAEERGINQPHSCDVLYLDKNGELNFIEFKNTKSARKIKEGQLKEKAYDSLLIFADKVGERISHISQHINLIVVYNKEIFKNQTDKSKASQVQETNSYDELEGELTNFANEHIIRFKLESLKHFCFKDVFTLNREEFEMHLQKIQPQQAS